MVFTRTSHWDPVLREKNLGHFIPPVFNGIRLNIIFAAYNFFFSSSSSLALRLVFRPWPPHLLPPTFAVPCCRLPVLYLRQIYSILPSTSRLCHRPSSSHYFFGDTRVIHPCYVSSHCSLFSVKVLKVPHHHRVCRSHFCLEFSTPHWPAWVRIFSMEIFLSVGSIILTAFWERGFIISFLVILHYILCQRWYIKAYK